MGGNRVLQPKVAEKRPYFFENEKQTCWRNRGFIVYHLGNEIERNLRP